MEKETSPMPPKAPRLTEGKEDALASQVPGLGVGGAGLEAPETRGDPEERDAWSTEEGDDSVFYSDEDPKATASPGFGRGAYKLRVNSAASDEDETDEGAFRDGEIAEVGTGATRLELQRPQTEPDPAEPGSLNCTVTNMRAQQNISVAEEQAEDDAAQRDSSAGLLRVPGGGGTPQKGRGVKSRSALKSFDHLASPSQYGTVSYRKIRRGNTRQKIEEFEHMMVNL